jgi:peptidoglycan/xylan/chitin deacetylase (PgdA/CDA1 family)
MRLFFKFLRTGLIVLLMSASLIPASPQSARDFTNAVFLKKLKKDSSYLDLKAKIIAEFGRAKPGQWGEFVKGVDEYIKSDEKIVAFTFDACGGKNGDGYDKELIDYLRNEKIPATLFVSGKWIDARYDTFFNLSKDTLFEIEDHGLNHRPCSLDGETIYGIKGTANAGEAFDEIEANARKIEAITGKRPHFYRSATAYMNESGAALALRLGITPISYGILSGDAVANTPTAEIEDNVIKKIKPGAIIIMHFNHPEWNTNEALKIIIPKLREKGYRFVHLKDFELTSIRPNTKIKTTSKEGTGHHRESHK